MLFIAVEAIASSRTPLLSNGLYVLEVAMLSKKNCLHFKEIIWLNFVTICQGVPGYHSSLVDFHCLLVK